MLNIAGAASTRRQLTLISNVNKFDYFNNQKKTLVASQFNKDGGIDIELNEEDDLVVPTEISPVEISKRQSSNISSRSSSSLHEHDKECKHFHD